MTIQVDNALPPNVVEIGNEITQGVVDGLMSASPSASSANPYATEDLLDGKLSLTGGTLTGGIKIDSGAGVQITNANYIDYPDHFSYLNINYYGLSCEGDQDPFYLEGYYGLTFTNGCGYSRNGITFSDSTVQTTAAVSPDLTGYLTKADNLASVVSSSSARTNLGLGAVSTDAYATTAQAQAGTSTTTVISPATLLDAKYFGGGKFLTGITWSTATSGTGASAGANGINARVVTAPTTAIGYAQNHGAILNNSRGGLYNGGIDWSKRIVFGGRINRNTTTPDTNTAFRFSLGRFSAQVPSDILSTDKQVGIKVSGSGAIILYAANGSALSTVTSSFTPTNGSAYDVVITSDGAGNVTLFVNGSSVATSTGGPTSSQGTNYGTISFETQNSSTLTNGNMVVFLTDAFVQVNI